MADKIKKETKKRYATLLPPSQVEAIDKLADKMDTSRAELYREGGDMVIKKYTKTNSNGG